MPSRTSIGSLFLRGERFGHKIVRPFQAFASIEASGGILMFAAALLSLIWINSAWSGVYKDLIHLPFSLSISETTLVADAHFLINDGLMTLFFFVVGLEIKREILVGDLGSPKKAALPAMAALGGAIAPALVYWLINMEGPAINGWGIPMATDIAFVTAALTLLGNRAPQGMALFLVSLAIVDDICAVIVIALFYSGEIITSYLFYALPVLGSLALINFLGFRHPAPYILLGLVLWGLALASGVHATVAGILVAFTIPCRSQLDTHEFAQAAENIVGQFSRQEGRGFVIMLNENNQGVVRTLENLCLRVEPPLQRIEHALHPAVLFVIMPLFALANAGVAIDFSGLGKALASREALGVIIGLCFGKPVGVAIFSWIAIRIGIAEKPGEMGFSHLLAGGLLCGIGFTMSLFIADLSFNDYKTLENAKLAIIVASLLAGLSGALLLSGLAKK